MKQHVKTIILATIPFLLAYALVKAFEYWQDQRALTAVKAAAVASVAAANVEDEEQG